MELREIHSRVMGELYGSFIPETILPALKGASDGAIRDVLDREYSLYYQWLSCLMRVLAPKQVVELGGAMGVSAICMCENLPETSKLYSITLHEGHGSHEHGLEFSYISTKYPQLIKIVGDDRDLSVWPKDIKWEDTDVLFIDAEHKGSEVIRELNMYLPLIGKGKLVILDDIRISDDMWGMWLSLKYEKLDVSELHHSGFGLVLS